MRLVFLLCVVVGSLAGGVVEALAPPALGSRTAGSPKDFRSDALYAEQWSTTLGQMTAATDALDPYREFKGKVIFTQRFMNDVAQCETGQDPTHIGRASAAYGEGATFRGAFGNWTTANGSGTFEYYGGRELSGTFWANEATYDQQKVVFIRKSLYGWYDKDRGVFVKPAGLSNNNCLRYALPIEYEVHK
jgi:hypothetical protein